MEIYLQQTWGVVVKDLRQWWRDPQALIGPMLVPLVLLLICTVLFGYGGDEWNIGLIVEGQGPEAQRFAQVIEDLHGNISPYFRIITRNPVEAQQLVEAGRLQLVITIPADFDTRIASGEVPTISTQVFNINTDMTKNIRLRLERSIQDYLVLRGQASVTVTQYTTRAEDVWRRSFISAGAVIIALLVGASLNTAIIVAREWERNTIKEIRLAPHALVAIFTGKIIAGLVATAINVFVTLVAATTLFGLQIPLDRWLPLAGFGLAVALTTAGIGLGVGAVLRDYRTLQPLLLITAAGSFFASGGYGSVATLPPAVRAFNQFWPPAFVFETMHSMIHSAVLSDLSSATLPVMLGVLAGLGFGAVMLRRVL